MRLTHSFCSIEMIYTIINTYLLFISGRQVLSKPKINDETLRHVIRGQDLYVNCTVDIDADTTYMFNWTTPQQVTVLFHRKKCFFM